MANVKKKASAIERACGCFHLNDVNIHSESGLKPDTTEQI